MEHLVVREAALVGAFQACLRDDGSLRQNVLRWQACMVAQQERGRRNEESREEGSVSVLFALVVSLCAATVAALFVTMWRDGDPVAAAALAFALLPVLVLTIMAWRAAL